MSDEPTKRGRGRPPRDPKATPAGRQAFHVGMRFNELREAQMKRLVDEANERARAHAVPTTVTVSSLIHSWILERLEAEIAKSDAATKRKR